MLTNNAAASTLAATSDLSFQQHILLLTDFVVDHHVLCSKLLETQLALLLRRSAREAQLARAEHRSVAHKLEAELSDLRSENAKLRVGGGMSPVSASVAGSPMASRTPPVTPRRAVAGGGSAPPVLSASGFDGAASLNNSMLLLASGSYGSGSLMSSYANTFGFSEEPPPSSPSVAYREKEKQLRMLEQHRADLEKLQLQMFQLQQSDQMSRKLFVQERFSHTETAKRHVIAEEERAAFLQLLEQSELLRDFLAQLVVEQQFASLQQCVSDNATALDESIEQQQGAVSQFESRLLVQDTDAASNLEQSSRLSFIAEEASLRAAIVSFSSETLLAELAFFSMAERCHFSLFMQKQQRDRERELEAVTSELTLLRGRLDNAEQGFWQLEEEASAKEEQLRQKSIQDLAAVQDKHRAEMQLLRADHSKITALHGAEMKKRVEAEIVVAELREMLKQASEEMAEVQSRLRERDEDKEETAAKNAAVLLACSSDAVVDASQQTDPDARMLSLDARLREALSAIDSMSKDHDAKITSLRTAAADAESKSASLRAKEQSEKMELEDQCASLRQEKEAMLQSQQQQRREVDKLQSQREEWMAKSVDALLEDGMRRQAAFAEQQVTAVRAGLLLLSAPVDGAQQEKEKSVIAAALTQRVEKEQQESAQQAQLLQLLEKEIAQQAQQAQLLEKEIAAANAAAEKRLSALREEQVDAVRALQERLQKEVAAANSAAEEQLAQLQRRSEQRAATIEQEQESRLEQQIFEKTAALQLLAAMSRTLAATAAARHDKTLLAERSTALQLRETEQRHLFIDFKFFASSTFTSLNAQKILELQSMVARARERQFESEMKQHRDNFAQHQAMAQAEKQQRDATIAELRGDLQNTQEQLVAQLDEKQALQVRMFDAMEASDKRVGELNLKLSLMQKSKEDLVQQNDELLLHVEAQRQQQLAMASEALAAATAAAAFSPQQRRTTASTSSASSSPSQQDSMIQKLRLERELQLQRDFTSTLDALSLAHEQRSFLLSAFAGVAPRPALWDLSRKETMPLPMEAKSLALNLSTQMIVRVDLSGAKVEGELNFQHLSGLSSLVWLDLSYNKLRGRFDAAALPRALKNVYLSHNHFTVESIRFEDLPPNIVVLSLYSQREPPVSNSSSSSNSASRGKGGAAAAAASSSFSSLPRSPARDDRVQQEGRNSNNDDDDGGAALMSSSAASSAMHRHPNAAASSNALSATAAARAAVTNRVLLHIDAATCPRSLLDVNLSSIASFGDPQRAGRVVIIGGSAASPAFRNTTSLNLSENKALLVDDIANLISAASRCERLILSESCRSIQEHSSLVWSQLPVSLVTLDVTHSASRSGGHRAHGRSIGGEDERARGGGEGDEDVDGRSTNTSTSAFSGFKIAGSIRFADMPCRNIQRLLLANQNFSGTVLLSELFNFPRLVILDLSGNPGLEGSVSLSRLPPSLQSVNISHCNFRCSFNLNDIAHLLKLESLDISGQLGVTKLHTISNFKVLSQLPCLQFFAAHSNQFSGTISAADFLGNNAEGAGSSPDASSPSPPRASRLVSVDLRFCSNLQEDAAASQYSLPDYVRL